MLSSQDPGQLGIYGFRDRRSYAYDDQGIAHSRRIDRAMLWDALAAHGCRSLLVGVPLTYPPPAVHGWVVSCFLTPSRRSPYAHPPELRDEIEERFPDYTFDVSDFRSADRTALAQRIRAKTEAHFRLARHLVGTRAWDFFMMVEMGTDRMQHAFWPEDIEEPGPLLDYYRYIDAEVGRLLALLDDDTAVMVVSDHGAQALQGGVHLNQWLIRQGYLRLRQPVTRATSLSPAMVDWSQTRAWADGGYAGRVYLNVKGREPEGIVDPPERDRLRREIASGLEALRGPAGERLVSRAMRPEDLYRECRGTPPDLLVYFDELRWRALGSIGGELFSRDNDRGPDGANHHPDGILILRDPGDPSAGRRLAPQSLLDVAPTILSQMGLPVPASMCGRVIGDARGTMTPLQLAGA
jgi:predicted AlkP superfamily phosphohydrolase/phosphomutase